MKLSKNLSLFILSVLKGIGQIMLQNNAWAGLLFLAGIFVGSFEMGFAALLATAVGTGTAVFFKYDKERIESGLYGFSAALVGVALVCFYQASFLIWIFIIIASALATMLQHLFIVRQVPAFTFPFILITWLFFIFAHYTGDLIQGRPASAYTHVNDYLSLFSHGMGQVIFQDSLWAGILFFIGLYIARPVAAIYAFVSIALASTLSYWLNEPINDIYLGLLSYNAVLCAITFAGKRNVDLVAALVSVLLSVCIMIQMRSLNLPALTFPFVLATWITLLTKLLFLTKINKSSAS